MTPIDHDDRFMNWLDLPVPIWVFDVETLAFVAVNEATVSTYGWSSDEFLTMTIDQIRPPQDVGKLHELVRDQGSDHSDAGIWRHLTKSGHLLSVRVVVHSSVLHGRAVRYVAALDVSSLALAEARAAGSASLDRLSSEVSFPEFLAAVPEILADATVSSYASVRLLAPHGDASAPATEFGDAPQPGAPVLTVPTRVGGVLAAEVVVAGKPGEYDHHDIKTLELLTGDVLRVAERERVTTELEEAADRQGRALWATIEALSKAAEIRDSYTAGHQRRVAALAVEIGAVLGLTEFDLDGLYAAGMLHDLGKLGVPAEILVTPRRLSALEFQLIQTHVKVGADTLSGIPFPWPVADVVRQHHERLDGTGYPAGLTDREIIPAARIIAVADVVEAMVSHRPYRPAFPIRKALTELRDGAGIRYDADVVRACEEAIRRNGDALPVDTHRAWSGRTTR
ncbi:MAG: HD domain-containing protein [Actinomycetota bacterium]|nr:HD domain-containing protein [Actinomycetota bacterium]